MVEKARLKVSKTKKGAFAADVEFASGKKMPLPPWYKVGPEHDGLECEVERCEGQIISVRVGGQELPRRGEGGSAGGKKPRPAGMGAPPGPGRLPISGFLPSDTKKALQNCHPDNLGLYLHKLGLRYSEGEDRARFSFPVEQPITMKPPWVPQENFFRLLDKRRQEALKDLGLKFRRVEFKLRSRLAVGLGAESVCEVALTLHHIYGFPYIPASALKGAVRNTVIAEDFGGREEKARSDTLFCLVFGVEDRKGAVRFFDAYPLEPPTLVQDVINPHYAPYYQGEGDLPPGDYYYPVPVFFGCVKEGIHLVFYAALDKEVLRDVGSEPLEKALAWSERSLSFYGIGAKTSAGYGLAEISKRGEKL